MKKNFVLIIAFVLVSMISLYGCMGSLTGGEGAYPENTLPPATDTSPDIVQPPTPTPPTTPTPTLPTTPTEPPLPLPEPTPPAPPIEVIPPSDVYVRANVSSLNIQSGMGTGYAVVGSMDRGDMLEYVSSKSGWYEVIFKRVTAYVSSSMSQLVGMERGNAEVERVVALGEKLLGLPYVFGAQRYHWGNGSLNINYTGASYDCSSLVQYIYKIGANINLDTTSRSQSLQGQAVARANLMRGDLMFFTNESRVNNSGIDRIGHVAMYLGDNYILHTASDYAVIEEISQKRWTFLINSRRHL